MRHEFDAIVGSPHRGRCKNCGLVIVLSFIGTPSDRAIAQGECPGPMAFDDGSEAFALLTYASSMIGKAITATALDRGMLSERVRTLEAELATLRAVPKGEPGEAVCCDDREALKQTIDHWSKLFKEDGIKREAMGAALVKLQSERVDLLIRNAQLSDALRSAIGYVDVANNLINHEDEEDLEDASARVIEWRELLEKMPPEAGAIAEELRDLRSSLHTAARTLLDGVNILEERGRALPVMPDGDANFIAYARQAGRRWKEHGAK